MRPFSVVIAATESVAHEQRAFRRRAAYRKLSSSLRDCETFHVPPLVSEKTIRGWLEWLACWAQAQKGLGSNRSRDAVGVTVFGKLFTHIVPLFTKQRSW